MTKVGKEILEALFLALVVFVLLQATVRNFKVFGPSMDPTLEDGQYLLVNRLVYFRLDFDRLSRLVPFWEVSDQTARFPFHAPQRGDVIVFHAPRSPESDFVKRVVGVPGDTVEIQNGAVVIDGIRADESYLARRDRSNYPPTLMGEGEYFVLGDNRAHSNDSRAWGAVPEENILGKVWLVYWPFSGIQVMSVTAFLPGPLPVSLPGFR